MMFARNIIREYVFCAQRTCVRAQHTCANIPFVRTMHAWICSSRKIRPEFSFSGDLNEWIRSLRTNTSVFHMLRGHAAWVYVFWLSIWKGRQSLQAAQMSDHILCAHHTYTCMYIIVFARSIHIVLLTMGQHTWTNTFDYVERVLWIPSGSTAEWTWFSRSKHAWGHYLRSTKHML